MKKLYRFIYFISSCLIYILLGLFEFFCLDNFVDMISTSYYVHSGLMLLMLIFVNPIITFNLIGLIPIKPKKRVKSVHDELKREVK